MHICLAYQLMFISQHNSILNIYTVYICVLPFTKLFISHPILRTLVRFLFLSPSLQGQRKQQVSCKWYRVGYAVNGFPFPILVGQRRSYTPDKGVRTHQICKGILETWPNHLPTFHLSWERKNKWLNSVRTKHHLSCMDIEHIIPESIMHTYT